MNVFRFRFSSGVTINRLPNGKGARCAADSPSADLFRSFLSSTFIQLFSFRMKRERENQLTQTGSLSAGYALMAFFDLFQSTMDFVRLLLSVCCCQMMRQFDQFG